MKMHEHESHDHHMRICQTFDNAVWLAVTGSATPMARKHYAFGACDTGSCAHQGGGHGRVPGSGAVNPWVKTVSTVAKMEAQVIDLRTSEIWSKVPVKMKVPPQASANWNTARGGAIWDDCPGIATRCPQQADCRRQRQRMLLCCCACLMTKWCEVQDFQSFRINGWDKSWKIVEYYKMFWHFLKSTTGQQGDILASTD